MILLSDVFIDSATELTTFDIFSLTGFTISVTVSFRFQALSFTDCHFDFVSVLIDSFEIFSVFSLIAD